MLLVNFFVLRKSCDILTRHLGIQFVYEVVDAGPVVAPTRATAADEATTTTSLRAALQALSPSWQAEFQQAAVTLDAGRIAALIAEIRPLAPHLAETLSQWMHNFDYEKIIQLAAQQQE